MRHKYFLTNAPTPQLLPLNKVVIITTLSLSLALHDDVFIFIFFLLSPFTSICISATGAFRLVDSTVSFIASATASVFHTCILSCNTYFLLPASLSLAFIPMRSLVSPFSSSLHCILASTRFSSPPFGKRFIYIFLLFIIPLDSSTHRRKLNVALETFTLLAST